MREWGGVWDGGCFRSRGCASLTTMTTGRHHLTGSVRGWGEGGAGRGEVGGVVQSDVLLSQ